MSRRWHRLEAYDRDRDKRERRAHQNVGYLVIPDVPWLPLSPRPVGARVVFRGDDALRAYLIASGVIRPKGSPS